MVLKSQYLKRAIIINLCMQNNQVTAYLWGPVFNFLKSFSFGRPNSDSALELRLLSFSRSKALTTLITKRYILSSVEDSFLQQLNADDFETILMTTGRNEQYHCSLPKSDAKATLVRHARWAVPQRSHGFNFEIILNASRLFCLKNIARPLAIRNWHIFEINYRSLRHTTLCRFIRFVGPQDLIVFIFKID